MAEINVEDRSPHRGVKWSLIFLSLLDRVCLLADQAKRDTINMMRIFHLVRRCSYTFSLVPFLKRRSDGGELNLDSISVYLLSLEKVSSREGLRRSFSVLLVGFRGFCGSSGCVRIHIRQTLEYINISVSVFNRIIGYII
jgi:hypothetical protein